MTGAFDALHSLDTERSAKELLAEAKLTRAGELTSVELNWSKRGNKMHTSWSNTILGHLKINGRRLTVEVNSANRAKKIKALIKRRLGDAARLRADRLQSVDQALAEHRSSAPVKDIEAAALAENPEVRAHLQKMMAEHYEQWISEKLPALKGQTPLEAVKDAEGREKVLALVLAVERNAQRMTPPIDPATLRRLRERLGLDGA